MSIINNSGDYKSNKYTVYHGARYIQRTLYMYFEQHIYVIVHYKY